MCVYTCLDVCIPIGIHIHIYIYVCLHIFRYVYLIDHNPWVYKAILHMKNTDQPVRHKYKKIEE